MATLIRPNEAPDQETAPVKEAAEKLYDLLSEQRSEVERAQSWMQVDPDVKHISIPKDSTNDAKALRDKAPTPWLGLAVTVVSQQLYAEGYRSDGDEPPEPGEKPKNSKSWDSWQMNRMDSRQSALYRGAIGHGSSFMLTLPGTDRLTKTPMPIMRGYSAYRMVAAYDDPANDEWPVDAMYVDLESDEGDFKDAKFYYVSETEILELKEDGGKFEIVKVVQKHGLGVPPVVRFCNMLDLDGNVTGEVTPFIPLASRLDQDTFDRLIVQRYGAWRVRWASGLVKPEDLTAQQRASLELRQGDLLVNPDPQGRFGTLEPTEMAGYIAAREADIRDLAAVTQIPPQYLLGSVSNMSAEALAASEAMLTRKVEERKHSFGESHEQNLRLAAYIMKDEQAASDFNSSMRWRDVESRSMAQVADALGKLSTMLELPWEVLVDRIPGWTDDDTRMTRVLKERADEQARDDAEALASAAGAGAPGAPPAKAPAKAAPTKAALATQRPPAA